MRVFSLSHERISFGQAFLRIVAGWFSMILLVSILLVGWVIFRAVHPENAFQLVGMISGVLLTVLWGGGTYFLCVFSNRTQTFCDYASQTLMMVPVKTPIPEEIR